MIDRAKILGSRNQTPIIVAYTYICQSIGTPVSHVKQCFNKLITDGAEVRVRAGDSDLVFMCRLPRAGEKLQ
jgi:hypothetical protein